jgi:hypothetical protein
MEFSKPILRDNKPGGPLEAKNCWGISCRDITKKHGFKK